TQDRAAAGTCRPTSSLLDLRGVPSKPGFGLLGWLCAGAGARARGQPQDVDEPSGILLVEAVAHGEPGQVSVVERVLGLPASDRDVALVEAQAHAAGNLGLCLADERVERLAQRREPQAVVD